MKPRAPSVVKKRKAQDVANYHQYSISYAFNKIHIIIEYNLHASIWMRAATKQKHSTR